MGELLFAVPRADNVSPAHDSSEIYHYPLSSSPRISSKSGAFEGHWSPSEVNNNSNELRGRIVNPLDCLQDLGSLQEESITAIWW